jgi:hypothetical protein
VPDLDVEGLLANVEEERNAVISLTSR